MAQFSEEQIRRYSRQILLREVGGHGQARLGAARPVLLCQGEVGQLAAEYLWRAGVIAPTLLATSVAQAELLTARLVATGYPGSPAQPLTAAPAAWQRLAAAASDFSCLWLTAAAPPAPGAAADSSGETLLWACCRGTWGVVGQGAATLQQTAADHPAPPGRAVESGAGAMVVGSALALLALQRILGVGPVPGDRPLWQLDLASPALPSWG